VTKTYTGEDDPVTIEVGQNATLTYQIAVDRLAPLELTAVNGTYYVQVTNRGDEPTSDLHVVTTIQGLDANGTWVNVAEIEVAYSTVLQPGETATYEAPVSVAGDYLDYRAITHTTIDNFVGHIGQRYGVVNYDGLETADKESYVIDEVGELSEAGITLPEGYTAELVDYDGPWFVNGSAVYDVTYNVSNVAATESGPVTNNVTLYLPSGFDVNASATVNVTSSPQYGDIYLYNAIIGGVGGDFEYFVMVNGAAYEGQYEISGGARGDLTFNAVDGVMLVEEDETAHIENLLAGSTVYVAQIGIPTGYEFDRSTVNEVEVLDPSGFQREFTSIAGNNNLVWQSSYIGA